MTDEKKPAVNATLASAHNSYNSHPHPPGTVVKTAIHPKKRRRKGQLNDGAWTPGCGPGANKPKR